MFDNLGPHFEIFSPLSVVLLILGAVLGYGAKYVLRIFKKENPTEVEVLVLKMCGVVLVIGGLIIIFTR